MQKATFNWNWQGGKMKWCCELLCARRVLKYFCAAVVENEWKRGFSVSERHDMIML